MKRKSCLSNQKKAGTFGHSASKASCVAKRQKLQHPTSRLQAFTGKQSSDRSSLAVPETETSDKRLRRRGSVGTQFPVASTAEVVSEKPSVEKQNDHYECTSTNYQAVSSPASDLKGNISLESGMENSVSKSNSSKSSKKKWLNLPCRFSKRLAGLHSELPKVEFSETNQQKSTLNDDRAVSNFASDLLGNNSLECGLEKTSSRSRNKSGKHKKKEGLHLPRRSSKRLAGLHLELPKVEFSETNQQKSTPTDDRAVSNFASDLLGKNSLECGLEKTSSRSRNKSGKHNKKGGLDLPRRSSRRLAGLKTVLPKVELSETNQQKSNLNCDKAVFHSSVDLAGKNSPESGMRKSNNKRTRIIYGKSNKKKGLDLPRRSSKRLDDLKTALPKVEFSEKSQQEIPLSSDKSVLNAAPELIRKNSHEKGMEKSSSKRSSNNSRKSIKNSGLDVPRRSSEKLAGLKAEMSKNTSSSEKALHNAVIGCEDVVVPAMDFPAGILVDEPSGPFEARPIAELARHAFSVEIIPSIGELLDKSQKYTDDKVVPAEQFQLETEKPYCEKSDFQFGDPCVEFAFKTLTGAMSREDAVANIPISTCAADILQEKNLRDSKMEKSCYKKSWTDVSGSKEKKELNMPCWPWKQTSGLEHELVGSTARQISARKSCGTKPYLDFDLNLNNLPNRASHKLNSGPEMGIAHRDLLHPNALLHAEPSKSKQILNDRNVAEEELGSIGSVKVISDKPVSQLVFPSVDYWSDPCLEFAFKTLTGAIPLDDNFAFPYYPRPELDISHKERDNNMVLPDFGLPSHFHSEISSHFDASERQPGTRQQLPLNPSVPLPLGNNSLPSCSAIGAQQPFMEPSKDIQEKVSS